VAELDRLTKYYTAAGLDQQAASLRLSRLCTMPVEELFALAAVSGHGDSQTMQGYVGLMERCRAELIKKHVTNDSPYYTESGQRLTFLERQYFSCSQHVSKQSGGWTRPAHALQPRRVLLSSQHSVQTGVQKAPGQLQTTRGSAASYQWRHGRIQPS